MESNKKSVWEGIKRLVKDFFTKRVFLKIVSLIFAMLLWGYVLMTQDPARFKTVNSVTVSVEGEADLLARKLIISGDRGFDEVAVKVKTQLTQYADLNADDITATINLAGITEKGTYTLNIVAKSSTGTVSVITPSQVSVEVDNLVTRRVPVEVKLEGEPPEGYWAGNLSAGRTEIEIEGAASTVAKVAKAMAVIDLTDVTASINKSMLLTLVDEANEEVPAEALLGTLPTVAVKLDVLSMKEVPVDITGALLGTDNLPVNYELMNSTIITGPTNVRIVGAADALAGIESVTLEPMDISGSDTSIYSEFNLVVPDGVTLLDDDTVMLYIDIREKNASVSFADLTIETRGLPRKLSAELSQSTVNLVISGRISLINMLERDDVHVYIDLTDYVAGTYEVPVYVSLPTEEMTLELERTLSADIVSAVVK